MSNQSIRKLFHKNLGKLALVSVLLMGASAAHAIDLSFDEFGSAYYGQSLKQDLVPFGFTNGTNAPDFTDFSLIGLNAHVKVDDSWSFFAQVIAMGGLNQNSSADTNGVYHPSNFNPFVQFAYITYKTPIDGVSLKGGRQGLPVLMSAEDFRIGFDQVYRSKPTYIYNLTAFSAFDGLTISKDFKFDIGKWNISVYGGAPVNDFPYLATQSYTVDRLYGVKTSLDGDSWRVRASLSEFHNVLQTPQNDNSTNIDLYSAHTRQFSFGYNVDKYNVFNQGEYTWIDSPTSSQVSNNWTIPVGSSNSTLINPGRYYRRYMGWYDIIGYRVGDFMPHYTYARAMSWDPTFPGKVTSHTFGLNYYASKNFTVKAEFEMDFIPTAQDGLLVTQTSNSTSTSTQAVYAGVDFKF